MTVQIKILINGSLMPSSFHTRSKLWVPIDTTNPGETRSPTNSPLSLIG
uniref:Uncharacterized protein n=1 Tax=Vibrio cholerae TaxID=666 RepID=K7S2L5_VIBCL|nr:hypothetical protein [Vibrio cholerae]